MRGINIAISAALLAGLSACGGSGPNGPSKGGEDRIVSLTIAPGTTMMRIKGTETFTATATMSSGVTSPASPAWRSSNVTIATIDGGGRTTALASGTTTITADYQGLSAPRELRVVPDYQGTWRGRLNVTGCTDEGDWHTGNFCGELGTGNLDNLTLTSAQQNAAITGTLDVGGMSGPITGSIATDGTLTLTGSYTAPAGGFAFNISIAEWQSTTTDNANMSGRLTFTMRNDLMTGMGRVQAELVNMNKTASTLTSAPAGQGRLLNSARAAARR